MQREIGMSLLCVSSPGKDKIDRVYRFWYLQLDYKYLTNIILDEKDNVMHVELLNLFETNYTPCV